MTAALSAAATGLAVAAIYGAGLVATAITSIHAGTLIADDPFLEGDR